MVLQLTNLHGDVTLELPADTTVAPTVLDADEYGNADPVNSYDLDGRSSKEWHEMVACESLGWSNCVFVMYLSGILSWNIKGNHGRRNAVRHFIWQASLTYFFGASAATGLGNAHEWGERCPRHGRCDTKVDQPPPPG